MNELERKQGCHALGVWNWLGCCRGGEPRFEVVDSFLLRCRLGLGRERGLSEGLELGRGGRRREGRIFG